MRQTGICLGRWVVVEAGRELDALVAERLGKQFVSRTTTDEYGTATFSDRDFPQYSTSIAAAWELVEHMTEDGWTFYVSTYYFHSDDMKDLEPCAAIFSRGGNRKGGSADTAPLAICLAFLKAAELA